MNKVTAHQNVIMGIDFFKTINFSKNANVIVPFLKSKSVACTEDECEQKEDDCENTEYLEIENVEAQTGTCKGISLLIPYSFVI